MTFQEYDKMKYVINRSVLKTDIRLGTHKYLDTTTCQDMLHSIYCTCQELKAVEYDKACALIQVIRPFQIKHHSKFFRNINSVGKIMSSTPCYYVRKKHRRVFEEDLIGLQIKVSQVFSA